MNLLRSLLKNNWQNRRLNSSLQSVLKIGTSLICCCLTVLTLTGCSDEQQQVHYQSLSDQASPQNHTPDERSENQSIIRVGTSGNYFPFSFSKGGNLGGFDVELMHEIGKRLDTPVQFITAPFSGMFGLLDAGKVDTVANQIAITKKRKQKYLFSEPYIEAGVQIAVQKGRSEIKNLSDLAGHSVGISLGSNYEHIIRQESQGRDVEVITYEGNGHERDLAIGRIDAIVQDRSSILALIKHSGLPVMTVGKPFARTLNALPFASDAEGRELQQKVNRILNEMRKDGTLKAFSKKWFGEDITV